ncbi:YraN family protein [Candidatus Kaiserbacteria bacterium]|nr:YraN family protein [Candidatus Kaiserbacteria bacterium]
MESSHISIGRIGEDAVANHLKRKGYHILSRNYRKKWGEIDVIAEKDKIIHFVEVKTVSYETVRGKIPRETWLPEENVEGRKLGRLLKTIETWLLEYEYDGEWQLDVAAVWLDVTHETGRIKMLENIIKDK